MKGGPGSERVTRATTLRQKVNENNESPRLLPSSSLIQNTNKPVDSREHILVNKLFKPTPRTWLDKMIDFIVGEGPSNQYALICSNCFSHNGLISPENYYTHRK
jgi:ABC-type phosphate transport system substrate-binding protein